MSFIPGNIDGHIFRTIQGEQLEISGGSVSKRAVEAGIRPENFILAEGDKGVTLSVEVVEPTGPETHIYGQIAGEAVRVIFRERVHVEPGMQVRVTAQPEHIRLFDKESGLPL